MTRMRPTFRRLVASTAAAGMLVLAGCSAPATPDGTSGSATLVVATSDEPDALNPVLNYGVDGASLIFDGLVSPGRRQPPRRRLWPRRCRSCQPTGGP